MQARIDTNGNLVADKSESRTEIEQGCRYGGPEVRCGDWCPLFAVVDVPVTSIGKGKSKVNIDGGPQVQISCGCSVVKYELRKE